MKRLAIVGSHRATRDLTPWDDPDLEIWVFNEAPQADWCKRWDVSFQMHLPQVYSGYNHVKSDHWDWLQQDHGPEKMIYMGAYDERVPNCRVYPIEEVEAMTPDEMLTSSVTQALALAIMQGREQIDVWGIELTSNSEYAYQIEGWVYWVGFARGISRATGNQIRLELHSGVDEHFTHRRYGYEGDPIMTDYYKSRMTILQGELNSQEKRLKRIDSTISEAMLENNYQVVAKGILDLENAGITTGAVAGALGEAETYASRNGQFTPRQELERHAAKAQGEGEELKALMHNAGGKCEYVWNLWSQTANNVALNQLRLFVKQKRQYAYDAGARLGIYQENLLYMREYDARIEAMGGVRALEQSMKVNE